MATQKIKIAAVYPGEILLEEFMNPPALSRNALARALPVPPDHVLNVLGQKHGVSARMALWLGLQQDYELDVARDKVASRVEPA